MKNKKTSVEALQEVMEEFKDYDLRLATFNEEHAEYIEQLGTIGEATNWKVKPFDPQEMQKTDDFINILENTDVGESIDDFNRLKYIVNVYHQFRAFVDEGSWLRRRLSMAQLALCIDIIKADEAWLKNAKNALAEDGTIPNLPDAIKTIEEKIAAFKLNKAQFELELAATNPNKLN